MLVGDHQRVFATHQSVECSNSILIRAYWRDATAIYYVILVFGLWVTEFLWWQASESLCNSTHYFAGSVLIILKQSCGRRRQSCTRRIPQPFMTLCQGLLMLLFLYFILVAISRLISNTLFLLVIFLSVKMNQTSKWYTLSQITWIFTWYLWSSKYQKYSCTEQCLIKILIPHVWKPVRMGDHLNWPSLHKSFEVRKRIWIKSFLRQCPS